ncbi:MAG: beta-ketoacyl synthase N-terminal-like domain-containing protein [Mariprofundaceae bacterium]|nr:beta-ketoacyl synthase N-terminal-like domain-containing protein [Mariprofundaceae bacterium]
MRRFPYQPKVKKKYVPSPSSTMQEEKKYKSRETPIAIIGMDGLFPDSPTLDDFWRNITSKHTASRRPPANRWLLDADTVYHPERGRADRVYSKQACFLDDAWLAHDPCKNSAMATAALDPMFHLLLRVGRGAWQDAAVDSASAARTGIIMGNLALPSEQSSALARRFIDRTLEEKILAQHANHAPMALDANNAHVAGLPAAVLAKALGLGGTCFTLDAACASSLYAIKLAMDELRAHRADVMLAGGLSRPDSLYTQMGFSQLQALSATGVPAPFDAAGDGLVVGEGCGVFVLKRLSDAEADANTIYGVIHAVGVSNDLTGGLLAPESEGQLRAMRSAYQQAGWSPSDVQMIECHAPGTPVGDVVEFESMARLWQDCNWQAGQCVIGSVKSNIGHLLTAAGSAALMKTLLAMKHGKLPPTANFHQAAEGITLKDSPFQVLQETQTWVATGTPRRAAISAFGFGGINAHLLLESYAPNSRKKIIYTQKKAEPIAIIGMAAHVGAWDSLARVQQQLFSSETVEPQPLTHWWGAEKSQWLAALGIQVERVVGYCIDEISAPLGAYCIPPHEMAEMLPRQLLMLNLAAAALLHAGDDDSSNTGVFIGTGLDMQASNFSARWDVANKVDEWLKILDIDLDEDGKEAWTTSIRDAISPPLNAGRTMGALGSTVASRIAKAFRTGGAAFTVSAEDQSGLRALEVGIHALQCGDVYRALVGAVDMTTDMRLFLSRHARMQTKESLPPLADGGGALILKRVDDAQRDGDCIYAIIDGFGTGFDVSTSLKQAVHDSLKNTPDQAYKTPQRLGDAGAANGILATIHATLSLHHRLRAEVPSKAWLNNQAEGKRQILVSGHGMDGSYAHILLQENKTSLPSTAPAIMPKAGLFVVSGTAPNALIQQLEQLAIRIKQYEGSIHDVACQAYQHFSPGSLCLSMVADDVTMLLQHIAYAKESLQTNPTASLGGHGSIPMPQKHLKDRVFYSHKPLANRGKVAFIFSGSGNHYPHMGKDLLAHWPHSVASQEQKSDWLKAQYLPDAVWQNNIQPLYQDHNALVISHVALGTAISDILRGFALHPSAAMGYSLGESTSLFSLGAWSDRDAMVQRLKASPLFTEELAGVCRAARKQWQLNESETVDWVIGMVNVAASRVNEELPAFPRAYLLITNTATECVIGGQRTMVMALVGALNAHFHPLDGVTTVHCDVVTPVADAYHALHLFDTKTPKGIDFYSFASGEKYTVNRENTANAMLAQAMHSVDFPRLIEQAYGDGVRMFFEIGAGQSCSRMIHSILGERPHLARSSCFAGESASGLVLRTLAQAIAEGLDVDLSNLYPTPINQDHGRTVAASKAGLAFSISLPKRKTGILKTMQPTPQKNTPPSHTMATASETNDWTLPIRTVLAAKAEAHGQYLQFSTVMQHAMQRSLTLAASMPKPTDPQPPLPMVSTPPNFLNRAQCLAFAVGNIGDVLGESFAAIDQHPTRVRLPDEPLMLVDRIVHIEGTPRSMRHGRVVTEHDVNADRWYLDAGHIPTCIAVEAGQADLFLSAYLGIDFITKGKAVYRLLDAVVTFHDSLPVVGDVIHYDIYIDEFFCQGDTWLFRFHFESTVNGQALMSMQKGCAGFFTQEELAGGQGIVHTALDMLPQQGTLPPNWQAPLPMQQEQWDDGHIAALYAGDLTACFGAPFNNLNFTPYTLPPQPHLRLVDRVISLDPSGGRYGIGQICAEMDIHPDDWFLTCHFVDDQVMPGTLMYECCMHTLRIFLLRMGWVGKEGETWCEPLVAIDSGLKCRGQVLASTKLVTYQVDIKTLGYEPAPFAIVNALMFADGKPIVEITNMSACLRGLTQESVEALWQAQITQQIPVRSVLYNTERITAFAIGKPSEAFGSRYTVFDEQRKIARLPGPPFQFLDRIMDVQGEPWVMQAGASVEVEYTIPSDAWYFESNRQKNIPFSVLLEIGLQPCGWLAAYIGSALSSSIDLSFRNLDGNAVQHRAITASSGILTTHVSITNVSSSGGMVIQNYDFETRDAHGVVYTGNTVFGFFSKASLSQQVGVRGASLYQATVPETERGQSFAYPTHFPYPARKMQMIDTVDLFVPDGGTHGLGFIRGTKRVDPNEWFFKAHFYQDPVCPGSLGLESFLQLLKIAALQRWGEYNNGEMQCIVLGKNHKWNYRGQIIPSNQQVSVEAMITAVDESARMLTADGYLSVDGKTIYQMFDFTIKLGG